ncbi:peptide-methionine (S)-S-oxide reductase MsrA [Microbulbifer sp. 2205BS26-8]|uniref:peptide-methionine (S)-S-oxide reductase MsrA n=1 Tax=Microbulbifer sp. 2205BS26-8 TaxID=3064386 RepID=UPI00273D6B3A|nr:peptide-methionine (S)-S-oxide reductase MsrA [Microbulbifer sp. 2205BS26-8]MDP5208897.1 peptide-methionine (S)-S-oxide reductase MsrA [Microbulbifer sp. 2205BS26-8]
MQYDKFQIPDADQILPGRPQPMEISGVHFVNGNPIKEPFPEDTEVALFGMGCFWGAERLFWETEGVFATAVGYTDGATENPNYDEVCSGRTGHAEVVKVVYDPTVVSYAELLGLFWDRHDPTQGMRQGNDIGSQYRSCIFCYTETQKKAAEASKAAIQEALDTKNRGRITTEISMAPEFYYAEEYHQQYMAKNKEAVCPLLRNPMHD